MTSQEFKKGSKIEIKINVDGKFGVPHVVEISRVSDSYVWFKHSGYQRIGKTTIDKYPDLYKIVSI